MTKKFLTSVANCYGYNDSDGTLLFVGKTLLDSSIETTLGSTDVRGGRGNQLQYVYYHTNEMNITISDAQWNLDFLAQTLGDTIVTSNNIFQEETITLVANAGSVTDTPLPLVSGGSAYGWVTLPTGVVEKVTFSTKAFTASQAGATDEVCVRYYALDTAARSVTVDANVIPAIVHLVLEAQLNSSDSTTNQIGYVQIDIPNAALSGSFTISMTPDGVASTPLSARALATEDTSSAACDHIPYYATIKEIITAANWYDNVIGIAIANGDFSQAMAVSGTALVVWAVPSTGLPFLCPTTGTEMTFSSGSTGVATITANTGIITNVATGTSLLHATITSKPAIDAAVTLTVTT